ncbi:citrate/2-methylcitrate synthase [Leifsonia sp. McL0607]|uniref:citrate/2-methylcitrate synthase n=1 Tax=Leifsonia sp. McL0607 TaxID=3415672 RepID=UPI003CF2EF96
MSSLPETNALPHLTAEQTAERLGVKLETLYSYVARGLLSRTRTAAGSAFDPLEVETFAAARRRKAAPSPARSEGRPLMVIETDFALIDHGELFYRGRPAAELAQEPFEVVARWALTGRWEPAAHFTPGPGLEAARRVAEALPSGAGDRDRQLVAVTALAAADPLRTSLDPEAVAGAAERLIAGMVQVLPVKSHPVAPLLAAELWSRLSPHPASPELLRTLDAALVLLLDHDLAVSTLAARAAASARATPYAVVVAGLGALDSPLHGNASRAAQRMLARVAAGEQPARVVADAVVDGRGPVPGFGQPLYPEGDPRARILLGMLADDPAGATVVETVGALTELLHDRTGAAPNSDLALAALSLAGGMADDAGEVIFATARTAGWIVHALAEYRERPLRLRPVGRYTPVPQA